MLDHQHRRRPAIRPPTPNHPLAAHRRPAGRIPAAGPRAAQRRPAETVYRQGDPARAEGGAALGNCGQELKPNAP